MVALAFSWVARLWGPPGTGKTTLARLFAETDLAFEQISAIFSGVADLKKCFEAARARAASLDAQHALCRMTKSIGLTVRNKIVSAGYGRWHRDTDWCDHGKPII